MESNHSEIVDKSKRVLWIDKNIESSENQDYAKKLDYLFTFKKASTVDEAFNWLKNKSNEFQSIYIIMSGSVSPEFMERYENELKNLNLNTANIIFCLSKDYWGSKEYANSRFKNPGSVVSTFDEVLNWINKDEKNWSEIISRKDSHAALSTKDSYGIIFKATYSLEDIAYPVLFPSLVNEEAIPQNELEKFKELIYNYGNPKLSSLVSPAKEKSMDVPIFVYAKYFIRMYTLQTQFYKDLNRDLSNKFYDRYRVFFYVLYCALNRGNIKNYSEGKLYRGSLIGKDEINQMMDDYYSLDDIKVNKPDAIITYCTTTFLSFSKKESVASGFSTSPTNETYAVIFIVDPLEDPSANDLVTNLDISKYSYYKGEQEVLFLPFSCFEITKIEEKDNKKYIYLRYLDRVKKKLKDEKANMTKKEWDDFIAKVWNSDYCSELNISEKDVAEQIAEETCGDDDEVIREGFHKIIKSNNSLVTQMKDKMGALFDKY